MNFEQWNNKPVKVAQCFSSGIARQIFGGMPVFGFRFVKSYRTAQVKDQRRQVALALREMRKAGKLDLSAARYPHGEFRQGGGVAVRCDLENLLTH